MRVLLQNCMFAFAFVATFYAQQANPLDKKLPDIVNRMENGDLASREAAFDELMTVMSTEEASHAQSAGPADPPGRFFAHHPEHADRVKLGLVHLLAGRTIYSSRIRIPPPIMTRVTANIMLS